MSRPDPYTPVHKMQRARLFRLTVDAGSLDARDCHARRDLAAAVAALADDIEAHGHHEERFVHPLLRRYAPAIATELEDAHVALDDRLDVLIDQARALAEGDAEPNELYRALAMFTASYLSHVDREETAALPALWEHCSDAEFSNVFVEFNGSRSAATNLASTLAMAPTLNPGELDRMLAAPGCPSPHDLADALAVLLPPTRFGMLDLGR